MENSSEYNGLMTIKEKAYDNRASSHSNTIFTDNMRLILAIPLLLIFSLGFGQEKEPIAVMDLKAEGVSQSMANILSSKLRTELFNSGKYNVLNREDMKAILGEVAFQQSGMCDDSRCLAKIGGALGVIYMVSGNIGKIGETYTITIKMIDIDKMQNIKIVEEEYRGAEDGLNSAIKNAGRKLLGINGIIEHKEVKSKVDIKNVTITPITANGIGASNPRDPISVQKVDALRNAKNDLFKNIFEKLYKTPLFEGCDQEHLKNAVNSISIPDKSITVYSDGSINIEINLNEKAIKTIYAEALK